MDAKGEERPMSCGIFVKYFPNVLSMLEPAILRPPPTSPSRTGNAHVLLSKDGFMMVDMGGFTGAKARALPLSISPSLFFRQKPCAHEHLLPMNEET